MKSLISKKDMCLWIKCYAHAFRVFGGLFFFLALVSSVFWIAGFEIEPIAFILGLCSSLFFSAPSVAEYFYPNRKPVKDMTFAEIIQFIPTTNPKVDWRGVKTDWISEFFLEEDPRLRFRVKYIDDGVHNQSFKEPWANCHPDSVAVSYWCNLSYDGAFLDRTVLVLIDGYRATLPLPDHSSRVISKYDYFVAKVHDSGNTLDDYIERSSLTVSS